METIIKNVHLLNGLLSDSDLEKLNAGALQHRKFSRITFKILSVTKVDIKVQAVQGKTPHDNYADDYTLRLRTKELFMKFLPLYHVTVNPIVYRPDVTAQVTPEYIRNEMTVRKVKVKDIVADTGIDKTNISAWMNGAREMSQPVKALFYYYFKAKNSNQI